MDRERGESSAGIEGKQRGNKGEKRRKQGENKRKIEERQAKDKGKIGKKHGTSRNRTEMKQKQDGNKAETESKKYWGGMSFKLCQGCDSF
jgi:hypothetical protein